jgi:hypothetical protein
VQDAAGGRFKMYPEYVKCEKNVSEEQFSKKVIPNFKGQKIAVPAKINSLMGSGV